MAFLVVATSICNVFHTVGGGGLPIVVAASARPTAWTHQQHSRTRRDEGARAHGRVRVRATDQHTPWQPSSSSSSTSSSKSPPLSILLLGMVSSPTSHDTNTNKTKRSLEVRGGGSGGGGGMGGIGSAITKLTDYIGATKVRCWTVLSIAIVIEIASTTLLNVASNEKSPTKLALAMGMYMTR